MQSDQENRSYSLFTKSLADATTKRLQMEMALRKGLELGEFRVVYQPQVSILDGTIVGVEALVRWDCAKFGSVPPSDFIPVAEQSGVIARLGEWVLRTACEEISQLALGDRSLFASRRESIPTPTYA